MVAPQLAKLSPKERYEIADGLEHSNGIVIKHVAANSAQFEPDRDIIQMPYMEQFESSERYYATLFHEMVHWTGHEKRLKRAFGKRSTEEYAFEELVAELGSAFLCAHFQIPASLTSSSAYIVSWLKALQNNKSYVLKAVGYAERAMNYLLQKELANTT